MYNDIYGLENKPDHIRIYSSCFSVRAIILIYIICMWYIYVLDIYTYSTYIHDTYIRVYSISIIQHYYCTYC